MQADAKINLSLFPITNESGKPAAFRGWGGAVYPSSDAVPDARLRGGREQMALFVYSLGQHFS